MRRFFQLIAIFALPAFLAACPDGKSRSSSSGKKTATTPLNTSCLSGQSQCYPQLYQQFPGFYPYPVNYQHYGGYFNYWQSSYGGYYSQAAARFCNCGPNAVPVYNNQLGLGCIRRQVLAPLAGVVGMWSLPAVNTHWTNLPQYSNIDVSLQTSCQNGVTQACFLHKGDEECDTDQKCRPVASGSALGICTRK